MQFTTLLLALAATTTTLAAPANPLARQTAVTGECATMREKCYENVHNEATCSAGAQDCMTCQTQQDECDDQPNANHATCGAQFYACAQQGPGFAGTAPTRREVNVTGECATMREKCYENTQNEATCAAGAQDCMACQAQEDECDRGPDANHATCTARFYSCAQQGPGFAGTAPTKKREVPVTGECATMREKCYQNVQNEATCSAGAQDCMACQAQEDSCDEGPDANHATCAAQFYSCAQKGPGFAGTAPSK